MSLPMMAAALLEGSSRDGNDRLVLGSKDGLKLNFVLGCFVGGRLISPKLSFLVPTFLLVVESIAVHVELP